MWGRESNNARWPFFSIERVPLDKAVRLDPYDWQLECDCGLNGTLRGIGGNLESAFKVQKIK